MLIIEQDIQRIVNSYWILLLSELILYGKNKEFYGKKFN